MVKIEFLSQPMIEFLQGIIVKVSTSPPTISMDSLDQVRSANLSKNLNKILKIDILREENVVWKY